MQDLPPHLPASLQTTDGMVSFSAKDMPQDAATWARIQTVPLCWATIYLRAAHSCRQAGAAGARALAAECLCCAIQLMRCRLKPVITSSITSSLPLPFCSYMCQLSSYSPEPVETNQCWLSAKPEGEPGSQCPSFPAPGYLGADTAMPAGGCCTCIWWAFGLPLGCGCTTQLANASTGAHRWSLLSAANRAPAAPCVCVCSHGRYTCKLSLHPAPARSRRPISRHRRRCCRTADCPHTTQCCTGTARLSRRAAAGCPVGGCCAGGLGQPPVSTRSSIRSA